MRITDEYSPEIQAQELGERVKTLRKALGLTQTQLADRVGYTDKMPVYNLERGQTKEVPARTLVRIAEELGTTVEYLCTGKPALEKLWQLAVEDYRASSLSIGLGDDALAELRTVPYSDFARALVHSARLEIEAQQARTKAPAPKSKK